jgi:hypothetical protein
MRDGGRELTQRGQAQGVRQLLALALEILLRAPAPFLAFAARLFRAAPLRAVSAGQSPGRSAGQGRHTDQDVPRRSARWTSPVLQARCWTAVVSHQIPAAQLPPVEHRDIGGQRHRYVLPTATRRAVCAHPVSPPPCPANGRYTHCRPPRRCPGTDPPRHTPAHWLFPVDAPTPSWVTKGRRYRRRTP